MEHCSLLPVLHITLRHWCWDDESRHHGSNHDYVTYDFFLEADRKFPVLARKCMQMKPILLHLFLSLPVYLCVLLWKNSLCVSIFQVELASMFDTHIFILVYKFWGHVAFLYMKLYIISAWHIKSTQNVHSRFKIYSLMQSRVYFSHTFRNVDFLSLHFWFSHSTISH